MSKKILKGKCPECGSQKILVYLIAEYNSTIDEINGDGQVNWEYSSAFTEFYCGDCDSEFQSAKDVE
tara:strand:- start:1256 stop:1456 length:201 start_codon:yes stop_codon:yes gene_type:complete